MEDEDRNTVTTIPSREDGQSPASTTKKEDNTTFEALCAPFLSNTPAPRPLVISPSMLSNFESDVLAAIPDLLTKVVVPAPAWARHWVIWHEALNPELMAATTRILFDKIKRYNYQLRADATPENVHAMKVLKADTGAIKAYLSMRVDILDLGNKRPRRVALSEAYLRLANYDKIDYISADYIHTSIIESYKYAVEDFKAAKAAARGSLMMPEDLTKLQQALNLLKTRLVKGLGILGARPTHLPPIAAQEETEPQTGRRKPMVSRWSPKQSYTSFPAPVFEAEKGRLEAEQKLREEEGRGPLKLAPAVCPVHLQWHLEHIRKPNVTKSQLLARLKKYQQDYALGSFSPHRNWTKVSAGGIVTLMEHIEQRITQDEYIPEDSPEKEADFNELPDNDRIASYKERLPLPTPTEEDMMRTLKNVNDLTRDHAMKIYDVILKCIDGSEGDLKDQCANFRRECLEICRDIMFGRIQKNDFGPPPEEVARQAQGLGPNTSIAGKQDFNKLAVNHGTASDIQRKRQASPGAMVPNPIKKEPYGYSKDGPLAKPMASSATLPEAPRPQAAGRSSMSMYPPITAQEAFTAACTASVPSAPAIPRSFTISEPHRVVGQNNVSVPEAGSFGFNGTVQPTNDHDVVMVDGHLQQLPTWYQHISGHPIRPPAAYTAHRRNARSSESRGSVSNADKKGGMVKSDTINKTVSGGVKKTPTMRKSVTLKAMQKAAKDEFMKAFDEEPDQEGEGGQGGQAASAN